MKVALVVAGGPRTFDRPEIYEPVRRYILDAYDSHTFAAIFEPYSEREYERSVWPYQERSYFRKDFIARFIELYGPIADLECKVFLDELPRLVRESDDLPRSTGRKYCHRAVYSQYEMWAETGRLLQPVVNDYDLVIKYRTDTIIKDWRVTSEMMEQMAQANNTIFVSSSNGMGWAVGPHGECGRGVCELMWICRPEVHLKAVTIFTHLHEYAKHLNSIYSEQLWAYHLRQLGLEISTFPVDLWFPDVIDDITW